MQVLDRWRWPLTVIVCVALAALAGVVLAGPALGVDPAMLESLQRWAMGIAAAVGAPLVALLARDTDGNGVPDLLERLVAVEAVPAVKASLRPPPIPRGEEETQ